MRKTNQIFVLLLALLLSTGLLFPAQAARAAAKKSMYVVTNITIKDGSTTAKTKVKYKKGFIKKIISPKETQTFTYGKKYQLKIWPLVNNKNCRLQMW